MSSNGTKTKWFANRGQIIQTVATVLSAVLTAYKAWPDKQAIEMWPWNALFYFSVGMVAASVFTLIRSGLTSASKEPKAGGVIHSTAREKVYFNIRQITIDLGSYGDITVDELFSVRIALKEFTKIEREGRTLYAAITEPYCDGCSVFLPPAENISIDPYHRVFEMVPDSPSGRANTITSAFVTDRLFRYVEISLAHLNPHGKQAEYRVAMAQISLSPLR